MKNPSWLGVLWLGVLASAAPALERPWVSDTFFYWYEWDETQQWGNWTGQGVYYTPLVGYYDSRKYEDNLRELWMASEWGLTHHFIDFWGPGWKDISGQQARETLIFRAAEALREQGYPIWVSFYQDGTDFDMRRFRENAAPGRHLRWILENYARSPVFPQIQGCPLYVVYSRNGAPIPSEDTEAFRQWLQRRYPSLDALNAAWQTTFPSWDEVGFDTSAGLPRADALRFYFDDWRQEWKAMEERLRRDLGLPGVRVSQDVAYQPYRGFGYSQFAATFGGPHSYGGIFGQPQDQDVQRFIQAIVAKHYDTVFFDHFKNFYNDWEIRIPGLSYPPDPFHFDRFWVGDLARYAEAVLHLSWNEWWEGSNLEPCLEYGKTYCQKNLFYSTLMHLAFPSIQNYARDAQVAVLLNDWQFLVGSHNQEDLYHTLQVLRRLTVPFELLPDDFVTRERLQRFRLVLAPAAGVGFGQNAKGQRISEVLSQWAKESNGRRLLVSGCPEWQQLLSLQPYTPPTGPEGPGPDWNVFVDVGTEGDQRFLVEGASGRENWGELPPDAFGASNRAYTVRWTPAAGRTTLFLLPSSPRREHVLRWAGSAMRSHQVTVSVNGQAVGTVELQPNHHEYELTIPADAIGDQRVVELQFLYQRPIIPREEEPQRFPYETRHCNLAIDWLQLATAGTPLSREQRFQWPEGDVGFTDQAPPALANRAVTLSLLHRQRVTHPQAALWSRYLADGTPHLFTLPHGQGTVLYLNGALGELPAELLEPMLNWAGVQLPHRLRGDQVIGTVLEAGSTLLVLADHHDPTQPTTLQAEIAVGDLPVAEAVALSADGRLYEPLTIERKGGRARFSTPLSYYGVWALVRCPVAVELPSLRLHPGESSEVSVRVRNLTDQPTTGFLRLDSIVPSIGSSLVRFALAPRGARSYPLQLNATERADWGVKTVAVKVNTGGQIAYFLRPLTVGRLPEVQVATPVLSTADPRLTLANRENGFIANAAIEQATLEVEGRRVQVGGVGSGQTTTIRVPLPAQPPAEGQVVEQTGVLRYQAAGRAEEHPLRFHLAGMPRAASRPAPHDALFQLWVANTRQTALDRELQRVDLDAVGIAAGVDRAFLFVRDAEGRPLATQTDFGRELFFPVTLAPNSVALFWLCAGTPPTLATDLQMETLNLSSGRGTVSLQNEYLQLVLDESRGGTATVLRSRTTGRDYGAGTFGVGFGHFGHYDPLTPAVSTDGFIKEDKLLQREGGTARLRVLAQGPLRILVETDWRGAPGRARQLYEFRAFSPTLRVESTAVPSPDLAQTWGPGYEVVALDALLRRQHWTKIFPNFTGTLGAGQQPHGGWRQAPYVPPVATLMQPGPFQESLSFLLLEQENLDLFRQGFWPDRRPAPGPINWAEIEYASTRPRTARVKVMLVLHDGKHTDGERAYTAQQQDLLLQVDPVRR